MIIHTAPDFRTENLNVFKITLKPSEKCQPRTIFLGCLKYEDVPFPVVSAAVWIHGPYYGHTLEMIQTLKSYDEQGLAKELWLAIEEHLGGCLWADGTEFSEIVAAIEEAHKSIGRSLPDYGDPEVCKEIENRYFQQRVLEGIEASHENTQKTDHEDGNMQ